MIRPTRRQQVAGFGDVGAPELAERKGRRHPSLIAAIGTRTELADVVLVRILERETRVNQ